MSTFWNQSQVAPRGTAAFVFSMLDHFSALESALWCIRLICGKKLNTFILAFFPDTKHVTSGCLRLWFSREPTCIVDMLVNSIFDSPSYFNYVASKLRLTQVHSSWELLNLYFMVIYIYIYILKCTCF